MKPTITSISFVDDLGSTPATVNRRTGEMYISARRWRTMTPDQRLFMILHEYGHVELQTTDEFEADRYALDHYAYTGRSLKNAVGALTEVLSGDNPEHVDRAVMQLRRAKKKTNLN